LVWKDRKKTGGDKKLKAGKNLNLTRRQEIRRGTSKGRKKTGIKLDGKKKNLDPEI